MFTADDVQRAYEEWGCNCGPSALAACLDMPLDMARDYLVGFDEKHYTNPTMMRGALNAFGVPYTWMPRKRAKLVPMYGLARVQWDGPWTAAGVPPMVAYRQTHWIASRHVEAPLNAPAGSHEYTQVFDINCMNVGGWVPFSVWQRQVVPWILKELVPKATGEWWITHVVEVARPRTVSA